MWNPWVTSDISSLVIYESVGAVWASNPWVSRYSTLLIISDSLGAVWAVESMGLPLQHFIDYFWVPRAFESMCLP
jgi:hypothetical protein